jgi:hypothetical protein
MIHVIQALSVRPKANSDNLSMSKIYPVLWIYTETHNGNYCEFYVVRGSNGVREYLDMDNATIETEV